ncbi:hypothetical protein ACJ41O_008697 [Fusarium nematophilum]
MSFGYSVGDVIAGANLTYRLLRIMADTKGASVEYLEAMSELSAMQQAFLQISQIRSHEMLPPATVNAASHIVLSSMDTIAKFLERTKHYQRQLEDPRASAFQNSWYKVGWTLYRSHELCALRDALHSRLTSVQVLLSAASYCPPLPATVAKYQVGDQYSEAPSTSEPSPTPSPSPSPEGGISTHDGHSDTAEDNPKGSEPLSSPAPEQNARTIPASESGSTRQFIRFKDAVGRKFKFPWEKSKKWNDVEDLIKQAFLQVDVLGPHVMEGHYDLIGPDGTIILPSVWNEVAEPEMDIIMTMWPMDKSPPLPPKPRLRDTSSYTSNAANAAYAANSSSDRTEPEWRHRLYQPGDAGESRGLSQLSVRLDFDRRFGQLDPKATTRRAVIEIFKDMKEQSIITQAQSKDMIKYLKSMSLDSFEDAVRDYHAEIAAKEAGSGGSSTRDSSRGSSRGPASFRGVFSGNGREYPREGEEDSSESSVKGQDDESGAPTSDSDDWEDYTDDEEAAAEDKNDDRPRRPPGFPKPAERERVPEGPEFPTYRATPIPNPRRPRVGRWP